MKAMDPSSLDKTLLGIAHALFMNRLHVLRLTEVVRLQIRPSPEDSNLVIPPKLDAELKQQAVDFVLTCFPGELGVLIHEAKSDWLRPA